MKRGRPSDEEVYNKCININLKPNDTVTSQDIIRYLKRMGYKRTPLPHLIGKYLRIDPRFEFAGNKNTHGNHSTSSHFKYMGGR